MEEKQTVYLETTIPSYLAARPTNDVLVVAKQLFTPEELSWNQSS